MAKILDRTTANRVFLIYGNLGDMFIAEDLVPCRFEYYLMKYLKSVGFEHVVFFSPNDKGRFTLDEKSAAFAERKKLQSSGGTAGGASVSSGAPSRPSGHKLGFGKKARKNAAGKEGSSSGQDGAGQEENSPKQDGAGREGEFQKQDGAGQNGAEQGNASTQQNQEDQKTGASDWNPADLKYKFPNINLADFVEMAQSYLTGKNGRTAVVFTNIQTFLGGQLPQKYHSMLSGEWVSYTGNPDAGACIFLAPNGSVSGIHNMLAALGMTEISNYFFEDGNRIRHDRTIQVGAPEKDEIRNLLEYMRIVGYQFRRRSFRLFFDRNDLEQLVECIYRCSRNRDLQPRERDLTQLSGIFDYLSDYVYQKCRSNIRAKGVRLTVKLAGDLFQNSGSAGQLSALEQLNVKGWEPVYQRLKDIVTIAENNRRNRKRVQMTEDDVVIEYEESEEKAEAAGEELPVCVSRRLDPDFGKTTEDDEEYTEPVPSFILKGHPGLGKTEIARKIPSVLYEAGILRTDKFLERDRKTLLDRAVGGTDVIMRNLLMEAEEGVLFIDEAYDLFKEDDRNIDYGKDVLNALLDATDPENKKHRICVILAGYPEEMDKMLSGSNAGLLSRFKETNNILIPDATPDLMCEKFFGFIQERGYHIPVNEEGEYTLPMDVFFENLYKRRNRRTFGNFRDVKELAKSVCGNASLRLNPEMTICKEDFRNYMKYFESDGPRTVEAALAQLDEFVGMEKIREKLLEIREKEELKLEREKQKLPVIDQPKHYIFKGNPGVGKTTVGTIMGQLFHLIGAMGAEETCVIDASELLVGNASDPTSQVRKIIQRVVDNNQLLFIDEGYQILDNVHGSEIINAMLNPLSEKADEFRLIISLYPGRVDEFFEKNPGLDRRFEVIEFEDYQPEQLMEIFERNRKKLRLEITPEARERVRMILEHKYNTRTQSFGNAAEAVDLLSQMDSARYSRVKQSAEDSDQLYLLVLEDIPEAELEAVESMVHPRTAQEIQEEISQMIGMHGLRQVMEKLTVEIQYARRNGGIYDVEPGHYFFIGAPGTGKTTSAKMFADYLYSIGAIKTNKFTKYSSKDLVSGYMGQSDKQAAQMMERGRNGVIFIDEAHELAVSYGGDHSSYEQQVLSQIIQYMEDEEYRKNTCIILAGYSGEMEKLFNRRHGGDPGLLSRGNRVEFPNYNAYESWQIFEKFCRTNGMRVGEGVEDAYTRLFEELSKNREYANGRSVRRIFRETSLRMKSRVIGGQTAENEECILMQDLLSLQEAETALGY